MFERFGRDARETVRRAAELAETEGSAVVHAEHLLTALVDPVRDPVGHALVAAGVTAAAVRAARDHEFRSALATVGIDTERPVPPASGRLRRGRTTRFAPSAKLALERTLDAATGAGDRRITNRHLVIAIVGVDVGRTPQLLVELGTTPAELLERLGVASHA